MATRRKTEFVSRKHSMKVSVKVNENEPFISRSKDIDSNDSISVDNSISSLDNNNNNNVSLIDSFSDATNINTSSVSALKKVGKLRRLNSTATVPTKTVPLEPTSTLGSRPRRPSVKQLAGTDTLH